MKKHLKKVAVAVALVLAILGGVIVVNGSGDPEDPPTGIFMVHTLK